jgi:hypothetical protein
MEGINDDMRVSSSWSVEGINEDDMRVLSMPVDCV